MGGKGVKMTRTYDDVQLICGCLVRQDSRSYPPVAFCPVHAAAPELLQACKAIVGRTFPEDPVGAQLRAAIAKAEGK